MITFLLAVLICDTVTTVPQCRWLKVEHYLTESECRENGTIFKHTDQVQDFSCTIDVRRIKDEDRVPRNEPD